MPETLTKIGKSAFAGITLIESFTLPKNVTIIDEEAFSGCLFIDFYNLSSTPQEIPNNVFCSSNIGYMNLVVPNVAYVNYSSNDKWNVFVLQKLNRSNDLVISFEGLSTLWLEYDAIIPEGVEAYYAEELQDSKVKMKKIEGSVLPRETGLIVKGTAGETYSFLEADTEGTAVESLLVGSASAKTFGDDGYKYYKLTYNNDGENFGFYLANEEGTIEAKPNKAYLKLPKTSPAGAPTRGIGIDWEDDGTTEIESVADFVEEDGAMFNLQGMSVGSDYKGIVIKNGKKIINK